MIQSRVIGPPRLTDRVCHIKTTLSDMERDSIWSDVCRALPTEPYVGGTHYCVLHKPDPDKDQNVFTEVFEELLKRGHSDFRAVVVPGPISSNQVRFKQPLNFVHAVFYSSFDILGGEIPYIYMDYAIFYGWVRFYSINFSQAATFSFARFRGDVSFTGSHFKTANFNNCQFDGKAEFDGWSKFREDVDFTYSRFSGEANFNTCTFEKAVSFQGAQFSETEPIYFRRTEFQSDVTFEGSVVNNKMDFQGDSTRKVFGPGARMTLRNVRINKPEIVVFHTVDLRPSWFLNVDCRKFTFIDVFWKNLDWDFGNKRLAKELKTLRDAGSDDQKARLFEIAARQLAVNAEENNRYSEAAKFRYMAMETRRIIESERRSLAGVLTWLYKWSSGYGESWEWAALVLLILWLGFGVAYWLLGDFGVENRLDVWQSIGYSSSIMLLQRPDLHAQTIPTFTLRILETILGPLQAALMALAIRRKFMR